MNDIAHLNPIDLRLFNEMVDGMLREDRELIPLSVIAERFNDALDAGVRDPLLMKKLIVDAGTAPACPDLPSAEISPLKI